METVRLVLLSISTSIVLHIKPLQSLSKPLGASGIGATQS